MHLYSFVIICKFVLEILSGNKLFAKIKGHNFGTNVQKMTCNNPDLEYVFFHAQTKFDQIL